MNNDSLNPSDQSTPHEYVKREVNGGVMLYAKAGVMPELMKKVDRVAGQDLSVLLIGKTGTGKGEIARYIHEHSKRKTKPYKAINCGGKDANFLEDELFGHVIGSYTGANKPRTGIFEEAEGGTIFLDELDKMPLAMQAKLLRVLNDRTFSKIGSNEEIKTDVRIIAAVNSLVRRNDKGKREPVLLRDLLERVNEYTIRVPLLRHRREDIPLLAKHFLATSSDQFGFKTPPQLPDQSFAALKAYPWPGNIRQLKNTVRATTLDAGDGGVITEDMLPKRKPTRGEFTAGVIARREGEPRSIGEIKKEILNLAYGTGNTKMNFAKEIGTSPHTLKDFEVERDDVHGDIMLGLARICFKKDKMKEFLPLYLELLERLEINKKIGTGTPN